MKTEPFWWDTSQARLLAYGNDLPMKVDVAVVGGGYTGLSAAYTLLSKGATVVVLEQNTIGWGASSRNGGMLTTGMKISTAELIKRYGESVGIAFWKSSIDAIDLVEKIVEQEDIDCDFRRYGQLSLAYKPSHFERMKKIAAFYRESLDYETRLVLPSDLAEEIGSKAYYGGVVDERAAGLDPARYVWGLGRAVARAEAVICEETFVNSIARSAGEFEVRTTRGDLRAANVLVATNGYTGGSIGALSRRVMPVGSYIIVTEPLDDTLARRISPKGRMFYDSKNFLNYFRLTPDNRMLFGGRNNLSTDLDLRESASRLRKRMVEVFPDLANVSITHSWSGKLGLTFDLMPHIGQIDGVFYALGYSGHGVSLATYLGREVALLLTGEKHSSPFAEISHPTRFYYRGNPWFLPFAAFYYRVQDWLH